jgi:hypothetical protein
MRIENVHERSVPGAGPLIDTLSSRDDRLWPLERWPRMRLDRGLEVGSAGGHHPIGYVVSGYDPGRRASFRFTAPPGLHGEHRFEAVDGELRHVMEGRTTGRMRVLWPLFFRPLHDAAIEDSLDKAAASAAGRAFEPVPLGRRVRVLRWLGRKLL